MNSPYRSLRILLIASALLCLPCVGIADDDYIEARRLHDSGEILSLEAILKNARETHPGRVLEVELEREDGSIVYEIEILGSDGIVRDIYMDARTGKLLLVKEDD